MSRTDADSWDVASSVGATRDDGRRRASAWPAGSPTH